MDTPHSVPAHAPELLAPAGDWDCARAAAANGADAVYFGLDCGFNARVRATNISLDEVPRLLEFLHDHRMRGYVTMNTLAFSAELESLEQIVRRLAEAGVDALLVQDLGLVHLIREVAPSVPIHASTQMTLTNAESISVIEQLGIERVILPRELSVREIARIGEQTTMPLEAFVHGALCVAYSGQCLTSESLGGRSANRGHCAQACRLPYELVCDGTARDLGDQKYLLSPQDLAAYPVLSELLQAGIMAFKIEGRLKTPEYVANITRHYRRALDAAIAGQPAEFTTRDVEEMELSFSRGFSLGWLHGCDHKALVPATSSANRGVLVGEVHQVGRNRITARLTGRLKAGDGVVFEGDRANGEEQGGRVFQLFRRGRPVAEEVSEGLVELTFPRDTIRLAQLQTGLTIWKTDDPALTKRLRRTFTGNVSGREYPVRISATAVVGEPLRIRVQADPLPPFHCQTAEPLVAARKHPLTRELLEQQLGRLGGTGFTLAAVDAEIVGEPMVPLSVLGTLRRDLLARLQSARQEHGHTRHATAGEPVLPRLRRAIARPDTADQPSQVSVLCRSLHQVRTMTELGVPLLYADFGDIRQYREAVTVARAAGVSLYVAPPRILKPGELGIFHAIARCQPDGVLVRNLAGLDFFTQRNVPCIGDYTLNAANELTVDYLIRRGARRATASYDLNREQMCDLARHAPLDRLEVVIHQHMPMFHMEHCVFCSVLSPGTNKTNCGRPCDHHTVQLRDRVGVAHPLTADVGCRNTLFNAAAQSGAEAVGSLQALGVRLFRVELLHDDPPDQLRRCVDLYRDLIAGRISGREVWTALRAVNRVGVTRGSMEQRRDPLAIL